MSRTIKPYSIDKKVFRRDAALIMDARKQIENYEDSRDAVLLMYKSQFVKIFIGKYFVIREKTRDAEDEIYLIPTSVVGAPYLINENREITCHLRCCTIRVQKSRYEEQVNTVICFSDSEGYYAHTEMEQVTKPQFRKALAANMLFITESTL